PGARRVVPRAPQRSVVRLVHAHLLPHGPTGEPDLAPDHGLAAPGPAQLGPARLDVVRHGGRGHADRLAQRFGGDPAFPRLVLGVGYRVDLELLAQVRPLPILTARCGRPRCSPPPPTAPPAPRRPGPARCPAGRRPRGRPAAARRPAPPWRAAGRGCRRTPRA